MQEHRASQIDRSNMLLVKLPVSGEDYWVAKPDDYTDGVDEARAQMPQLHAISGQNMCQYCGQGFNSPNVLKEHVQASHAIASGQADMTEVEMPDGTMVPAAAVPELIKDRERDLEARNAELEAKLEELAAKVAEK